MAEPRFAAPRRPWVTPFAWTVLRAIWRERAGGSVSFAGCAREDVFCLPVVDVSSAFSAPCTGSTFIIQSFSTTAGVYRVDGRDVKPAGLVNNNATRPAAGRKGNRYCIFLVCVAGKPA